MKRHNREKREQIERNVPEILKVLWELEFVEQLSFSKVKGEMWPKVQITISCNDENKIKMLKILLQKYEFPFSNLKITSTSNSAKKEDKATEQKPEQNKNSNPTQINKLFIRSSEARFKFKFKAI
jgi:hypothetical protein